MGFIKNKNIIKCFRLLMLNIMVAIWVILAINLKGNMMEASNKFT